MTLKEVYEQIIPSTVKDGRRVSVLSKSSEFDDDISSGINTDIIMLVNGTLS